MKAAPGAQSQDAFVSEFYQSPSTRPADHPTKEFVFLLTPMFSMLAFAAAIEPLRMANRMMRSELYTWRLVSDGGEAVTCSNGSVLEVDGPLEPVTRGNAVVVCTGLELDKAASRNVITWLRKQARLGVEIGAVCTGADLLARAGLLTNKKCSIHWENHAAFTENYPEIELSNLIYCVDDDTFTCAGGTASTDMMLHLIARDQGPDLGSLIADGLIHTHVRSEANEQRLSVPARIGVRHPKLVTVIQTMEQSTEEPISPSNLAKSVNMSTRQLERLFRRYLDRSPKRYYMELRLEKARNLLLQTNMSVINVALACGFTSPSHFSKCYRAHYNRTPYRERGGPSSNGKKGADSPSVA
ncbi:GlxA family transcriptional regulator [Rhodobacteraceae bacterium NNCM2]|nr:GlxA family transcriptional regulator [Coraliihabitans acroporae]